MSIESSCTALYGDRDIPIEQNFVIQPNMDRLTHPAEPLLHGCLYNFELTTLANVYDQICLIEQIIDYTIPECVQFVCSCNVTQSPYELIGANLIRDKFYSVEFKKTDSFNGLISLEGVFDKVWYTNINSNKTITLVPVGQIHFESDQLTVQFNDFHEGNSYLIYVDLIVDSCDFHFSTVISVQTPRSAFVNQYIIYSGTLCAICLVLAFILLKIRLQILEKLRKYLPFNTNNGLQDSRVICEPTSASSKKEVVNTQYTPLEFIVNSHKFDHYEIPKTRIALKQEIGGGAFGKVYRAELFDRAGVMSVAVKKPIDNAPSEEIADFLTEIDTMKRVENSGGHPNIIKLLACATLEPPYLMVMELVPCGSLKSYLSHLRSEWEERKRGSNHRHFFPDNMVVENYLPSVTISSPANENQLKYSDLDFNRNGSLYSSSETNSYITPDTPSTPGSPFRCNKKGRKLAPPPPLSPLTPMSLNSTSSGLPSVTGTLMTPLDTEPPTPLIDFHDPPIKPNLDSKDLHNFALQIANGMAFLESLDITHRDLAARNILINQEKTLKISDFGMARKGVYVNTAKKRQPLRWMAPEAIECRKCDNKTDVWSFGVVLWEIASLGAFPYNDLSNEDVISYIVRGHRLERPETCTDQLYDLMRDCWHKDPDKRPTFGNIARRLDNVGKTYVDFSKISPGYVFPPALEEA
ncbi:fibroblast growth factor receptor 1 isoform X2 [Anthonomus grandis grandis]|nr:fibroblast growth factor receptor 1 isoform X2 [Anthonomus grandis grandis]XP_050310204.1 fibroblast growth factor receptor 1 isoform X2 [Anthonomus grandis grandis]